jgi:hypothetical protein
MLPTSGPDVAKLSSLGGRRRRRLAGDESGQTRQIVHRTREIVASTI